MQNVLTDYEQHLVREAQKHSRFRPSVLVWAAFAVISAFVLIYIAIVESVPALHTAALFAALYSMQLVGDEHKQWRYRVVIDKLIRESGEGPSNSVSMQAMRGGTDGP